MYKPRYDSYTSSSDGSDCENLSSNTIGTLDFSSSHLTAESFSEYVQNADANLKRRFDVTDTLILGHNLLNTISLKVNEFSNVKTLDLSNNQITSLPERILQLPLHSLIVKNNRLSNNGLPKCFKKLTNLKVFNLSGNQLINFPKQVLGSTNLEYLYLGNNKISDIPKEIEAFKKLKVLCLGGNCLTEIPATVGELSNLQGLILSDNMLETLPSSIANLKNLRSLLLHKNRLRTLPTEIIALECLSELSLRENPLVVNFVSDMLHNPPSLLELAGRTIKLHNVEISDRELPLTLRQYLKSAHRCVNPKCKGVFFDNRVEHIKFVDFCGKYRLPLLQYLCSSKCVVNNAALQESYTDTVMMRKVLLG